MLYYDNIDIEFYHDNGAITSLMSFSPGLFEVDGVTLDKNRADLIGLLGSPTDDFESGLSFHLAHSYVYFDMGGPDDPAWRIYVYPGGGSLYLNPGHVYYKGEPLAYLLGVTPDDLYAIFGSPVSGTPIDGYLYNGGEFYGYDGIIFIMDYRTGGIGWISGAAGVIEMGGVTLDKTRTELTGVLGEPSYEAFEEYSGDYVMEYLLWGDPRPIVMQIAMPGPGETAHTVTISPFEDGPGDDWVEDGWEDGWNDPIGEYYTIGDTVSVNGLELTLVNAFTRRDEFWGHTDLIFSFEVHNTSDSDKSIHYYNFEMSRADSHMMNSCSNVSNDLLSATVKPGRKASGNVSFIYEDSAYYDLYYDPGWFTDDIVFRVFRN
jgi:hypothetical protein